MTFREALRNWANKPTKLEKAEKVLKEANRVTQSNIKLQNMAEESAIIRNQKKQIVVLEELLDKSYNQITKQSEVIASHKEGDWMDKLIDKGIDIADTFITPKPKIINVTPKPTHTSGQTQDKKPLNPPTETGFQPPQSNVSPYTTEEIKRIVDGFKSEDILRASKVPYGIFSGALQKEYPRASKENILEAYNLVQEKAENGEK